MTRSVRAIVVALGAAAVAAVPALVGQPAHADTSLAACHWINGEYLQTYTCDEPAPEVVVHEIVDCWKYPPSPNSYVREKTPEGWVRNPDIPVRTAGTKGCSSPYPYRTVVRVPGDVLPEMTPVRLRLVMPVYSGVLPDGEEFESGRTTVTYAACLMPADATDWCARR